MSASHERWSSTIPESTPEKGAPDGRLNRAAKPRESRQPAADLNKQIATKEAEMQSLELLGLTEKMQAAEKELEALRLQQKAGSAEGDTTQQRPDRGAMPDLSAATRNWLKEAQQLAGEVKTAPISALNKLDSALDRPDGAILFHRTVQEAARLQNGSLPGFPRGSEAKLLADMQAAGSDTAALRKLIDEWRTKLKARSQGEKKPLGRMMVGEGAEIGASDRELREARAEVKAARSASERMEPALAEKLNPELLQKLSEDKINAEEKIAQLGTELKAASIFALGKRAELKAALKAEKEKLAKITNDIQTIKNKNTRGSETMGL